MKQHQKSASKNNQKQPHSANRNNTKNSANPPRSAGKNRTATTQVNTASVQVARAPETSGMTKSSKSTVPSATAGDSRTLQIMTRSGVLREVVIRQASTFELLVVNAGAKDAQEILCDSEDTATHLGDKLKKQGSRIQRGERRIGF